MLPAFESLLSGTWAQLTVGGQKAFVIVFLPATAEATEAKGLAAWLDNIEHDAQQRSNRIAEMESTSGLEYSTMENEIIQRGMAMFAVYESSLAVVKKLPPSATIDRLETKLITATGVMLGRAEAEIRTSPLEIVAYTLNYCNSRVDYLVHHALAAADPNTGRSESLASVHGCHEISFFRVRLPTICDRTFLYSAIAKRVAEHPPTYAMFIVPIPGHAKIGPKDEAGAVRAEVYRSFKLTEVEPGVTKLVYCCSLDLKGRVPQVVTNSVALPQQLNGV